MAGVTSLSTKNFAPAAPRASGASSTHVLPGGWRLARLIADGRLTRVYAASHVDAPASATPAYAVKLLRSELEGDSLARRFLQREARLGRAARHAHLVSVLADHTQHAPCFLVTPWLTGESLADRLSRFQYLPTALAFSYVRQIAEALAELHRLGFVHGDIKPANIHVSRSGHATLLDLGFARAIGEQTVGPELALLGTPNYLAPELLRSGRSANVQADFYALGVTLFELLTGQLPRALETQAEGAWPSANEAARRLRRLNPFVSSDAMALVCELLADEPLRRPATADELVQRLVALEIAHLDDRVPLRRSVG